MKLLNPIKLIKMFSKKEKEEHAKKLLEDYNKGIYLRPDKEIDNKDMIERLNKIEREKNGEISG